MAEAGGMRGMNGTSGSASLGHPADPAHPAAEGTGRKARMLGIVLACCAAAVLLFAAVQWLTWPDVAGLAMRPPERTAFMDAFRARRRAAGEDTTVSWRWVEWDRISVHLKRAAVAAEDMEFFSHSGFSASEMEVALRDAFAGERFRGASTITQQLAKNLWLSPSRNPWRKVKEALLTKSLERHLDKRRILAIYLNVVEFGPGVYGAEAAARRYFGVSAAELTEHQAAMLAAGLPRPSTWHPGTSSAAYARYVSDIEARMERATFLWRVLGAQPAPLLPDTLVVDSLVIPDVDSIPIPDSVGPRPPPADTGGGAAAVRELQTPIRR
jgi:monofunctional biosynthetic peptidoglycan transglycosylase